MATRPRARANPFGLFGGAKPKAAPAKRGRSRAPSRREMEEQLKNAHKRAERAVDRLERAEYGTYAYEEAIRLAKLAQRHLERTEAKAFDEHGIEPGRQGGLARPGWWTLVDNGAGNDVLATHQNGDRMSHLVLGGGGGAGTQVMGGTVSASQINPYPGQFNDQATGAPVWKSPTSGTWYWGSEFNYTARFQYQAVAGLYRQAIQSLTFTATFPAVPNGATVVISAAT